MSGNYLTLTRQALYDLVWSTPMTEVAAGFGISDVALAKRCAAVDVPVPPRGWWARHRAGHAPAKTPLPPLRRRASSDDAPEPPVRLPRRPPTAPRRPGRPVPVAPPPPPTPLDAWLPAVKRAARHYRHPDRAALTFAPGETRGPFPRLDVSPALLDRALQFADRLLRAAAARGWTIDAATPPPPPEPDPYAGRYGRPPAPAVSPPPPYARLRIGDDALEFHLEERRELVTRPPTPQELARQARDRTFQPPVRTETKYLGQLRLVRPRAWYGHAQKSWSDRGSRRVDDRLDDILADFAATVEATRVRREQQERQAREWAEQARLRKEQEARVQANAEWIAELERQAGAWHYARRLRAYLRAARRALAGDRYEIELGDRRVDFLEWAETYVDEIDPLSLVDRHPDRQPPRDTWFRHDEADVRRALQRWLNRADRYPDKLRLTPRDEDETDDEAS